MAILQGALKFTGSVGGLTFIQGDDGKIYVKEKNGPSKRRMKVGEEFANTRRINAEFKAAGKATRTFRAAMGSLMGSVQDRHLAGRITAWLYDGLRTDQVSDWGDRRLQSGDVSLLEGFEFNRKLPLDDLWPVNLVDSVELGDRAVKVALPAFRLRRADKCVPKAATHFRVVSAMVYVDFDKGTYACSIRTGALTAVGRKSGEAFVAEHLLQPMPGQMSFWLVGIEFYTSKGDVLTVVRGGALRVMKVWGCKKNVSECDNLNLGAGKEVTRPFETLNGGVQDRETILVKCGTVYGDPGEAYRRDCDTGGCG